MQPSEARIREAILLLVARRGAGRTICPSEVARGLAPHDWRTLMEAVRAAARLLAQEGRVAITRRGVPVAAARLDGGPIRLGLPDPAHAAPQD
jgi:hypothetical protein